ncbi:MAG TPA: GIY-YIG nuclease family protein [bacterium]|nr:GIY-YIG nuclease family protein [bacterium]
MNKLKQKIFLYIARCKDNTLYIGITTDTKAKILRHNNGSGSVWIKTHREGKIVYTEEYDNYLDAHRRELQIKKWRREKKENLIKYGTPIIYANTSSARFSTANRTT